MQTNIDYHHFSIIKYYQHGPRNLGFFILGNEAVAGTCMWKHTPKADIIPFQLNLRLIHQAEYST